MMADQGTCVAFDLDLMCPILKNPFKFLFAAVQSLSVTTGWNDNFVMGVRYTPGLLK